MDHLVLIKTLYRTTQLTRSDKNLIDFMEEFFFEYLLATVLLSNELVDIFIELQHLSCLAIELDFYRSLRLSLIYRTSFEHDWSFKQQ